MRTGFEALGAASGRDSLLRPTLAVASTAQMRADWSTEPVASLRPVQFHATDCTCTHQRRHNK